MPLSPLLSSLAVLRPAATEDNARKPHDNVLFLCTGNSARSIMAEGIMNFKGRPQFTAYRAGSHPSGKVRPEALRQLEVAHVPTSGFRSRSQDQFAKTDAAKLGFVFTACDNAANEVGRVGPGQPMTAHWGCSRSRSGRRHTGRRAESLPGCFLSA